MRVQVADLVDELLGTDQLIEYMRDEPFVVTRGEERRWDAPQLGEAPVLDTTFP